MLGPIVVPRLLRRQRGAGLGAVYALSVNRIRRLQHEIAKFGTVGAMAYVIDVGIFNALRFSELSPISHKPITAKIISALVATVFAYFGNRYWAFRGRLARSHKESISLFFGFNGVGMAIAALCLAFSHYVLRLQSPAADNLSANIIGTGLGTLFRFWSYRRFIFTEQIDR